MYLSSLSVYQAEEDLLDVHAVAQHQKRDAVSGKIIAPSCGSTPTEEDFLAHVQAVVATESQGHTLLPKRDIAIVVFLRYTSSWHLSFQPCACFSVNSRCFASFRVTFLMKQPNLLA